MQARLFPQELPPIGTLEYGGACIQARQVGGDYYDFLSLGRDRLGLVLGDIAGKGIAGALLMANLQANLRSQCARGACAMPTVGISPPFCYGAMALWNGSIPRAPCWAFSKHGIA